jgi:DNA gyrase subunit B
MLSLHSRYDRHVVEQAAMAGALTPKSDETEAAAHVAEVARRLDAIAEETERGWSGEIRDEGYIFKRTLRGVTQAVILDSALLHSSARQIYERFSPPPLR